MDAPPADESEREVAVNPPAPSDAAAGEPSQPRLSDAFERMADVEVPCKVELDVDDRENVGAVGSSGECGARPEAGARSSADGDRSRDNQSREKDRSRTRDRDRDCERSRDRRDRDRQPGRSRSPGPRQGQRRNMPEFARRRSVFVSNIPFEMKWQDLKDLFKAEVGPVKFSEVFTDEQGKSKGCGVIEFDSLEAADEAVRKMHRFEVKGRKIIVRREVPDGSGRKRDASPERYDRRRSPPGRANDSYARSLERDRPARFENTYGLNEEFLRKLGVEPPLLNRVLVGNIAYHVDHKKLWETFKLAGKLRWISLIRDKNGKSRGSAVVEYDSPLEAVQAISMFDHQMFHDRRLTVKMDHNDAVRQNMTLPPGLQGVGKGLGANGTPLCDVANNFRELDAAKKTPVMGTAQVAPVAPVAPVAAVPTFTGVPLTPGLGLGVNPAVNSNPVAALNALQSLLQSMPRAAVPAPQTALGMENMASSASLDVRDGSASSAGVARYSTEPRPAWGSSNESYFSSNKY